MKDEQEKEKLSCRKAALKSEALGPNPTVNFFMGQTSVALKWCWGTAAGDDRHEMKLVPHRQATDVVSVGFPI